MNRVVKGDGSPEDFDREKLVRSMRAAGVDGPAAEDVASVIEGWNDRTSTREIRRMVVSELSGRSPESAERYDATRRLVARAADGVAVGSALLPSGVILSMRLGRGDVRLGNDGRARAFHVVVNDGRSNGFNEVYLNPADMEALDLADGDRVVIVRDSPGRTTGPGRSGGAAIASRGGAAGTVLPGARPERDSR